MHVQIATPNCCSNERRRRGYVNVLAKQNIMLCIVIFVKADRATTARQGSSGTLYSNTGKEVRVKGSDKRECSIV